MKKVWYRSVWVDKDGWEITLTFEVVEEKDLTWRKALAWTDRFESENPWLSAFEHAYLHDIKEEEV